MVKSVALAAQLHDPRSLGQLLSGDQEGALQGSVASKESMW